MPRPRRIDATRESTTRAKPYTPPAKLSAPPAPPGVSQRWVRTSVGKEVDAKNMSYRMQEGYVPVRAEDRPGYGGPSHGSDSRYAGVIGVGDLILMQNAEENVEARRDYYEKASQREIEAIDQQMFREDSDKAHMYAPRRKSTTLTGTRRPSLGDEDDD